MKIWVAYCFNLLRAAFEWIWFPVKNDKKLLFATIFCNLQKLDLAQDRFDHERWVEKSATLPFIQLVLRQAATQVALFCYNVVLVSQGKGSANFIINCILYLCKHLKNFWHMWPLTGKCSLRFAVFEQIAIYTSPTLWICSTSWKQEILSTSQLAVQKFLNPFDLICSKIFFTHSTSSIQIFIFVSHSSVQKFSSSVWKIFIICSSISCSISNGLAIHFSYIRLPRIHL